MAIVTIYLDTLVLGITRVIVHPSPYGLQLKNSLTFSNSTGVEAVDWIYMVSPIAV